MSAALALPAALSAGQTDRISGVALAAALLVLAVCLALALAKWNDDDDQRPGYVEIPREPADTGEADPARSLEQWRADAQERIARSHERRGIS